MENQPGANIAQPCIPMQEFSIRLSPQNNEETAFLLENAVHPLRPVESHRRLVTGHDRTGSETVNGSMPVVVHGNVTSGSEPHTLVIFDWHMRAGRSGKRFREVHIEVAFKAAGKRGDAEPIAAQYRSKGWGDSLWDPEVVNIAPMQTKWHQKTPYTSEISQGFELNTPIGIDAYATMAIEPAFTYMKKDSGIENIDATKVMGTVALVNRASGGANAVRWDFLENEKTRSGVPSFVRTAILLKRQKHDNGQFTATVTVKSKVNFFRDTKEKILEIGGSKTEDEPVLFDPKDSDRPGEYENHRERLDHVNLEDLVLVETLSGSA